MDSGSFELACDLAEVGEEPLVEEESSAAEAERSVVAAGAPSLEELEAWRAFMGWASGAVGSIPAELLVRHVFDVTPGADFAVRRAAFEALERRLSFRDRDGLRVAERPAGGSPFGVYTTRQLRSSPRPYAVLLRSVKPLRASCDCRDFLRNSLGLCKHVLTVLEDLSRRKRRFARALEAGAAPLGSRPRLAWCPVRALTGPGDWLDQVFLTPGAAGGSGLESSRTCAALAEEWLTPVSYGDDRPVSVWQPRETFADDPVRRLDLVRALQRCALPPGRKPQDGRQLPDPALLALLERERVRLERRLELIRSAPVLRRALKTLARPLYPYQREGVERMFAQGRLLLADDMGLGKTVQAIAACHALYRAGKVRRGLLIVPASLKTQWQREWKLFTDVPARVVEGPPSERAEIYRQTEAGFLIGNYALVRRDLAALQAWGAELIVLDEAQRIKNWATQTAGAVKSLHPTWRLVLTGTPMENRLGELASILDWVDDVALEPKWRLAPHHTLRADASGGAAVGAQNLGTLRERLAPCLLRRKRDEVLDQLPPRTDTTLPVELTGEQRVAHDDLNQSIASLSRIRERRPLTRAEFLRLMSLLTTQRVIANGMAQLQFAEVWPSLEGRRPTPAVLSGLCSPKLGALRELLAQLVVDQERKVVVFSQWRRMLTLARWAVSDLLAEVGLRALFFTGRESQRRRTQNVVDFHDDPSARVLFATDAGGVGLNLQRAATCCVNLELPWNPAVLEQRIARIHRLGQTQPIDVYNLVAPDCIEERIASTVSAKAALFQSVFDGTENEVVFEGAGASNFLEQLCRPAVEASAPEAPTDLDRDEQEHEVDAVLDAADESLDLPDPEEEVAPETPRAPPQVLTAGSAPTAHDPRADRAAQAEGAGANDAADAANAAEGTDANGANDLPPGPTPPRRAGVRELFRQVAVTRTASGGLRLEAPAEAAETLAALLEGFAGLLAAGTHPAD